MNSLDNKKKYVIYGAGGYGEIALLGLRECGIEPQYFLDQKLGNGMLNGVPIYRPADEYFHPDYIYIVAAGSAHFKICSLIKAHGCAHIMNCMPFFEMNLDVNKLSGIGREFWFNKHLYYGSIHEKKAGEIFIPHVDFCTTEFCSLKCKNCSQLIPYFPNPQTIDLDYSLACFDRFLDSVDYITEVRVLGGEPFCNVETYKVIEHLAGHPKIGKTVIYTNGTIIPPERLLKDLAAGMAIVHVSDYGASRDKLKDVIDAFSKYPDIIYFVRSYDNWMDLGNYERRDFTRQKALEIFDNCNQRSCKHFNNDRFYSCPRVASLSRIGVCGKPTEWVDFSNQSESTEVYREQVARLLQSEEPYEACYHCNGSLGAKPIPAAEQLKREQE